MTDTIKPDDYTSTTPHPSTYCAICRAPATAWSQDSLVLRHVVTGEEETMIMRRGAWCSKHAQSGSVTYQEWGMGLPSTFFDEPQEGIDA